MDDIDSIDEKYKKEFGTNTINISNWNSSKEFKNDIIDYLSLQNSIDNLDYIFSYEQTEDTVNSVLNKLGFSEKKRLYLHILDLLLF